MSRGAWLKDRFEYLTTTQVKCRSCGVEMDVRAGRAWKHWSNAHGDDAPVGPVKMPPVPEEPPPPVEPAPSVEPAPPVVSLPAPKAPKRAPKKVVEVGSREWAVKQVVAIAEDKASTKDQRLDALKLLKDYEDYGRERIDDEKESAESLAQWDRILSKVDGLQRAEAVLLRDNSVRVRLAKALGFNVAV